MPSLPAPSLPPVTNTLIADPALPQHGAPFNGCTGTLSKPPQGGEVMYDEHTTIPTTGSNGPYPDYQVVVDPWMPCVVYRVEGPSPAHVIDRSVDGGRTWQHVFSDTTSTPLGSFALGALVVGPPLHAGGPGTVWLGDVGNGDAVVTSGDGGATWSSANRGIAGLQVINLWPAASDPATVYALAATNQDVQGEYAGHSTMLVVTRDGGSSWALTALPPQSPRHYLDVAALPSRFDIAVDPKNPQRVVAELPQSDDTTTLYQSSNGGATFTPLPPMQGNGLKIVAAYRPETSALRLYLLRNQENTSQAGQFSPTPLTQSQLLLSDDGGLTWQAPSGSPPVESAGNLAELVVDPTNGDRLLFVEYMFGSGQSGNLTVAIYTDDGFHTAGRVQLNPSAEATWDTIRTPLDPRSEAFYPPQAEDRSGFGIQADESGTFYLSLIHLESTVPVAASSSPFPPAAGSTVHQWYVRVPEPAHTTSGVGDLNAVQTQVALQLAQCSMSTKPYALTYDGVDLLYVDPGAPNAQTLVAPSSTFTTPVDTLVVHKLKPATSPTGQCVNDGDLHVHFNPSDLDAIARAYPYTGCVSGCSQPWIDANDAHHPLADALTYDQGSGSLIFAFDLIRNGRGQGGRVDRPAPLFRAHVVAPGNDAVAAPLLPLTTCSAQGYDWITLAADSSDGTLWGCNARGSLDHYDTAGTGSGTCMYSVLNQDPSFISNWLIPQRGHLIELYDNQQIFDVSDSAACVPTSSYRIAEDDGPSPYANDGLACDPLSFQAGSVLSPPSAGVWVADPYQDKLTAYAFPVEDCPLLTAVQLGATTPSGAAAVNVVDGSPVCLDATLLLNGYRSGVNGEAVRISEDGTPLSPTTTGSDGATGCVPVTLHGAGRHVFTAAYTGDGIRYESSSSPPLTINDVVPSVPVLGAAAVPPPGIAPLQAGRPPALPQPPVQVEPGTAAAQEPPVQQASQAQAQPAAAAQREEQQQLAFAVQYGSDEEAGIAPAGTDASPAGAGDFQAAPGGMGGETLPGVMGVVTTLVVLGSMAFGLSLWQRREFARARRRAKA